jgi:hypothetical protein
VADGGQNVALKTAPHVPYSEELAMEICRAIATTPKGLPYICATREGFPHPDTVYEWLFLYPEFEAAYDRAKQCVTHALLDECQTIADNDDEDCLLVRRNDGQEVRTLNREFVQRSELMVKTRMQMIEKLHPKKFGRRLDLDTTIGIRHEDALAMLR